MYIYFFVLTPVIIFLLLKLIGKYAVIPYLDKQTDKWVEMIANEEYDLILKKTAVLSKVFPFHLQIQYYRALAFSYISDTANAVKILKKILSINKNFADAYYMMAHISQYNLDDSKIALENIIKAIELNDQSACFYNTASIIYESMNNYDSAIEMIDKAISLNKNYIEALNNKGVILFKQGKIFDSLKVFKKGLELNSDDPELLCNTANAYCLAQEYSEASKLFEKAYGLKKEPFILYWLAGSLYLEKKIDEAEKNLRLSLEYDDKNAEAFYLLSVLLSKKNLNEESAVYWNKAIEINPEIKNRVNN